MFEATASVSGSNFQMRPTLSSGRMAAVRPHCSRPLGSCVVDSYTATGQSRVQDNILRTSPEILYTRPIKLDFPRSDPQRELEFHIEIVVEEADFQNMDLMRSAASDLSSRFEGTRPLRHIGSLEENISALRALPSIRLKWTDNQSQLTLTAEMPNNSFISHLRYFDIFQKYLSPEFSLGRRLSTPLLFYS